MPPPLLFLRSAPTYDSWQTSRRWRNPLKNNRLVSVCEDWHTAEVLLACGRVLMAHPPACSGSHSSEVFLFLLLVLVRGQAPVRCRTSGTRCAQSGAAALPVTSWPWSWTRCRRHLCNGLNARWMIVPIGQWSGDVTEACLSISAFSHCPQGAWSLAGRQEYRKRCDKC